jgi:hypothetical protein
MITSTQLAIAPADRRELYQGQRVTSAATTRVSAAGQADQAGSARSVRGGVHTWTRYWGVSGRRSTMSQSAMTLLVRAIRQRWWRT